MLNMLDETNNKATFFILGMLAKYRPQLVKILLPAGMRSRHSWPEPQSHVHTHSRPGEKRPEESVDIVSNITGQKIHGWGPFLLSE